MSAKAQRSKSVRDGGGQRYGASGFGRTAQLVCGFSNPDVQGAKAVVGGGRHGDKGYFVQPTVLVDTNENMKVVREEISAQWFRQFLSLTTDDVLKQS